MKMTFRWYGESDSITLDHIRQIPCMTGVVTAVYSVPVHEDIKLRRGNYQLYIDNYKENIRRLAKVGVKCICYNFMPVFDWTRSRLDQELSDGSNALVYYKEDVDKMDPTKMTLPGWDASYTPDEMAGLIEEYKKIGEEGLWANLEYFIKEIMPVAVECDVNMAIHPDDPPWSIFDIPRIITNEANLLYGIISIGSSLLSVQSIIEQHQKNN